MAKSIITYSFYLLFFLTPLVFSPATSELFEFNKMVFVYLMAIIIGCAWAIRMIQEKTFLFNRTPLDIPLSLFLLSQILSTIFSNDPHMSIWGYYTRLNGGLVSILSYILLFYAFVSNFEKDAVAKMIKAAIAGGVIVSLWAIPEHFGTSPSCILLTGEANDSCWVQDVQSRVFATLGQPNWLAAYLAMLIFPALYFLIKAKGLFSKVYYLFAAAAFYAAFTYTYSRGGFLGLVSGLFIFLVLSIIPKEITWDKAQFKKLAVIFIGSLIISSIALFLSSFRHINFDFYQSINFSAKALALTAVLTFFGFVSTKIRQWFQSIKKFENVKWIGVALALFILINVFWGSAYGRFNFSGQTVSQVVSNSSTTQLESGGTESGAIRLIVWKGALKIFKAYPIFGSGVETFASAYYQYRPLEHNNTSEWDFLYNKAHNEYLNYLATTGLFGFLSYMSFIAVFIFWSLKKVIANTKSSKKIETPHLFVIAILASYISYLIQNFFGFSVVIVALFFYLFPGLSFVYTQDLKSAKLPKFVTSFGSKLIKKQVYYLIIRVLVFVITVWFLIALGKGYLADLAYKQGSDYSDTGSTGKAYSYLLQAVSLNSNEPLYKSELGYSAASAALAINQDTSTDSATIQEDKDLANELKGEAESYTTQALDQSPNNTSLWRTAIRTYLQISLIDPIFEQKTLQSIDSAISKAPTDPKLEYNKGMILQQYEQLNEKDATPQAKTSYSDKIISSYKQAIALKPDYHEALFQLATYYKQLGQTDKALEEFKAILKFIPDDPTAKEEVIKLTSKPNS